MTYDDYKRIKGNISTNNKIAKRKIYLWFEDPHCYWCGRLTTIEPKIVDGKLPKDYATVEHLYDGFSGLRGLDFKGPVTVLACYECNNDRAKQANKIQVIEMKKKKVTKAMINRKHAKKRLTERYGLELNHTDLREITRIIQESSGDFAIGRVSHSRTKHLINYKDMEILVVYDKNQKTIVTALPK